VEDKLILDLAVREHLKNRLRAGKMHQISKNAKNAKA
jgi:hypothetical protein